MEILIKNIEKIFSPIGLLVILLISGVILSFLKHHRDLGRRFLISGAILYLIFMFSPLGDFLIRNLEKQYPPLLFPPSALKVDRIVILSAYGEANRYFPITSNLSDEMLCRLAEGIRLYYMIPNAKIIVSGGIVNQRWGALARVMAVYLQQMRVPEADVVMENKSRNTYENLAWVRKLIGSNPFILVTSACDQPRAVAVARKLQMNPLPAPACIRTLQHLPAKMSFAQLTNEFFIRIAYPSPIRFLYIQRAYHEYLGYVWYWIFNRV